MREPILPPKPCFRRAALVLGSSIGRGACLRWGQENRAPRFKKWPKKNLNRAVQEMAKRFKKTTFLAIGIAWGLY